MAINKLKDEIKDILKASVRGSRRALSKGRLETYVFKKHFIAEWCQYCLDTVGVSDLKLKKRMVRAFFIELKNKTKQANAPLSMHDKGEIADNFRIPAGGFFLWLKVKDDEEAAKILWNKFSLRVMPGSFMGKKINDINPGSGYLRISLVDTSEIIEETMKRLSLFLKNYNHI